MKILVGYDGSNASKKALRLAKQHAAIRQGSIEVVQAIARKAPLFYDQIEKAEKQLAQQMKSILAGNRGLRQRCWSGQRTRQNKSLILQKR
jgi:nucleotide-binding universal stress UspA family protein